MLKKPCQMVMLIVALLSSTTHAQEVDSIVIDGEQYYVYPFNMDVDESYHYWKGLDTKEMFASRFDYEGYLQEQRMVNIPEEEILTEDEFNQMIKAFSAKSYKKFQKLWLPKMGPGLSKEDFEFLKDMQKGALPFGEEGTYMDNKKFKKAMRANPYPFLMQRVFLDQDITPMLDPIPNGKYIQYYEPFCLLTKEGSCTDIKDQIAGFFSIENNVLHGEATWVDLLGDTIKHGYFDAGLKSGEWTITDKRLGVFSDWEAKMFVKTGVFPADTSVTVTTFKDGAANGLYSHYTDGNWLYEQGNYKDGEKSGEWSMWWPKYETHSDERVFFSHYFLNGDDSLIVHPVMVRSGLIDTWQYDRFKYNFESDYSLLEPSGIYSPAFPKENDLDLAEETDYEEYGEYNEYEKYYDDYEYYDEYYYEEGEYYDYYDENRVYDPADHKYKSRALIYDSLGAYPLYDKVYEMYYPNGQLAFKFEFENGLLKEEPKIFWDNGIVHDEVVFNSDSNQYNRKLYDYDGVLLETFTYDSIGNFVTRDSIDFNDYEIDLVELEGFKFYNYGYYDIEYLIPDSILEQGLNQPTIISKTWLSADTSAVLEQSFNPEAMSGGTKYFGVLGNVIGASESTFSENYSSWTGSQTRTFGPFELKSIRSASLHDEAEMDSIPILMLKRPYYFNVDQDFSLYYDGEPLTGPMKIDFSGKKLKFEKSKMCFPVDQKAADYLTNIINKYRETGKVKDRFVLENTNNKDYTYQGFTSHFYELISPLTSYQFSVNSYDYEMDWDYLGFEEDKKQEERARPDYIEGFFKDGKAEGTWIMYDQFGKAITKAEFSNGLLEGKVEEYAYQDPVDDNYYYYEFEMDTFPSERTYFMSTQADFSHGQLNGNFTNYNWMGEVINSQEFKDGLLHGISMERNKIAVSYAEYEYGALDGYLKTYLTLPERDSILLFDLNFQNGLLQGESKSYHTNGKISKRGFFLEGEPIEDYEGYDSLGTLYHYVKFEYSFPVEEKLWEENELSVRYLFDWEDSIYFVPMNITNSESLESLLIDAGLSDGYEYQPYYGRQTIVNKFGVDYHMTKYYPNDTIARDGAVVEGRKSGHWDFYGYEGNKLYEVNYFDSLIVINDSVKFNSKGIYTGLDQEGNELYRAYIIEKSERFDCSHKDHYEVRQLYTISEIDDSVGRMNGLVYNYYDNGTLQSYGNMKDGLPSGEWRYYDPAGKLIKYGNYVQGKRNGRWLSGDLSKTKYLGDICLNPNMPDLEDEIRFRENFLDIQVINYKFGRELHKEYYDINMNQFIEYDDEEGIEEINEEE